MVFNTDSLNIGIIEELNVSVVDDDDDDDEFTSIIDVLSLIFDDDGIIGGVDDELVDEDGIIGLVVLIEDIIYLL